MIVQLPKTDAGRRALRCLPYILIVIFVLYLRHELLQGGFIADDYAQLGMLDGTYPLHRSVYDLFTFSNGDAAEGRQLIDKGFYPWWADPTVRISMFRPLASLMTALDFKIFGSAPIGYHVHSFIWWLLLLWLVASCYHRWLPVRTAVVAFGLFAIANAHGLAVGWICNRSAIISMLFALAALRLHVQFRGSHQRSAWLSWLLFALAIGFGEYALCTLGYFIAFEWASGGSSLRERMRGLTGFAVIALVYLVVRGALGMSMRRSGIYVDAASEPLSFIMAALVRMPVLIGDLVLAVRADYWTFGAPFLGELAQRGWVPYRWAADIQTWRTTQLVLGLLAAAIIIAYARGTRRSGSAGQPSPLWLLIGALLSLIPVCGSFPSSRLTLIAVFGVAAVIASRAVAAWDALWTAPRSVARSMGAAALLLFISAIAAITIDQQRYEARAVMFSSTRVRDSILQLNVDEKLLAQQDVLIMTAVEGGMSMYLPMTRARYGHSAPRACWPLSFVNAPYTITRTSPGSFDMRFLGGGAVLRTAGEQLLRSERLPFRVGQQLKAGALTITILELASGLPSALNVAVVGRTLEDPTLLLLFPSQLGYQRVRMPTLGEGEAIMPPPLSATLPSNLMY